MSQAQKITTFLWYDGAAEEAAALYISIFENSHVVETARAGGRVNASSIRNETLQKCRSRGQGPLQCLPSSQVHRLAKC